MLLLPLGCDRLKHGFCMIQESESASDHALRRTKATGRIFTDVTVTLELGGNFAGASKLFPQG